MTDSSYSARSGRRFAFTVGAALAVISGVSYWRGHDIAPLVLATIAGILVLAGAAVPEALGAVERGWMKFAHALSRITTPLFMGIIYFVVLTPIGFLRRTFGANPPVHRPASGSYWIDRAGPGDAARRRMERQF